MTCIDLNLDWPIISDFSGIGGKSVYAHRQTGFFAVDGVSSVATLRHLRSAVSRRSENQIAPVLRALARDGFRAADLSGKPARHRNVPACRGDEAVSHGNSQQRLAEQSVECQSTRRDYREARFPGAKIKSVTHFEKGNIQADFGHYFDSTSLLVLN